MEQITKQLNKLIDVIKVVDLTEKESMWLGRRRYQDSHKARRQWRGAKAGDIWRAGGAGRGRGAGAFVAGTPATLRPVEDGFSRTIDV